MRIAISKMGSVLWDRSMWHRSSSVGEQGETLGTARALRDAGHTVAYYGVARGVTDHGIPIVEPNLDGINEDCAVEDQLACFRDGEDRLARALDGEPDVFVHVLGYSPTGSFVGNSWGARVQACSSRYNAPQLHAVHRFKKPRICIVNDPRSYPKDQEMTHEWPECVPSALLGQRSWNCRRVVGGREYLQVEVYAGAQEWWKVGLMRPPGQERTRRICTVAHCHVGDGFKVGDGRDYPWQVCYSTRERDLWTIEDHEREDCWTYGRGWEHFSGPVRPGEPVRPAEVETLLSQSRCGPVMASVNGFYTAKLGLYAWCGCAPLLYGRQPDHPATYDPLGRYLSLDSPVRIAACGDLARLASEVPSGYVEELYEKTMPDVSLLLEAVERPKNWERFGGMVRL